MVLVGQVVFAKNGRDKGCPFIISKIEGDFVFIVNGRNRILENPKKKKLKHVQLTNYISQNVSKKLLSNSYILDAEIRQEIKNYTKL